MTSEEPLHDEPKKPDDRETNGTDKQKETKLRTNELMRLVYELPEELDPDKVEKENNNMLKENPPIVLDITEQNGCDAELDNTRECDSYLLDGSSPDLGNNVVYDNSITHDEYKEVIDRSSPDCTDEDLEQLKRLLESKPKALERYLKEVATTEEVQRLHSITSSGPLSPRPRHEARSTSVTSDLFQLWLSSSPVKVSNVYHISKLV
ncbi:hypothetical protein O0L34_g6535 [Tuta absoluta]|nr:hypothetical protein O0L34_g6535 [Tuta absoluta]